MIVKVNQPIMMPAPLSGREKSKQNRSKTLKFPYQRRFKVRSGSSYPPTKGSMMPRQICPEPVPWVNIKGYWLNQAGFTIGTRLQAKISQGQIILTALVDNSPS